jgi:hypothetical protein
VRLNKEITREEEEERKKERRGKQKRRKVEREILNKVKPD